MNADEVHRHLADAENETNRVVGRSFRHFLEGAATVETLGQMYGWWKRHADEIVDDLREIWHDGYRFFKAEGVITSTSLDGLEVYMGNVSDRLVRGLVPPVAEDSFSKVRGAIVLGAAQGWSRARTAREIAARLSWEKDGAYWREAKAEVDAQIDRILDPLGQPGSAAREWASNNDPAIAALRVQRNLATAHLDVEHSYWQDRATTIARTESTGAFNAAALGALSDEGWDYKRWLSTPDTRTRPSHRHADGQVVALASPFRVGGSLLMMPGDPTAPPGEVINCRCAVIGAKSQDETDYLGLVAAGNYNPLQARVPRGNGPLSGRWIDMPDKIIADLLKTYPDASTEPGKTVAQAAELVRTTSDDPFDNFKPLLQAGSLLGQYGEEHQKNDLVAAGNNLMDFAGVDWMSDSDNLPPGLGHAAPSYPSGGDTGVPDEVIKAWGQPGRPMTSLTAGHKANVLRGTMNCQLCVTSYEMRKRGFDVTAKLGAGYLDDPSKGDNWEGWFDIPNGNIIQGQGPSWEQVEAYGMGPKDAAQQNIDMLRTAVNHWPVGSRGVFTLSWELGHGTGHIMNWEKTDKGIYLVDTQGETLLRFKLDDLSNDNMRDFWLKGPQFLDIARLDNVKAKPAVANYLMPVSDAEKVTKQLDMVNDPALIDAVREQLSDEKALHDMEAAAGNGPSNYSPLIAQLKDRLKKLNTFIASKKDEAAAASKILQGVTA